MPEPEHDDETTRQASKLSRAITVNTEKHSVSVPVFRPTIQQMPDFKQASIDDFERHAEHAAQAAQDELRRITLILSAAVELL